MMLFAEDAKEFPEELFFRYTNIRKIDEGGMGVVYEAHDTTLNKDVAIKTLRGSKHRQRKQLMQFQREAKAQGRLKHSNLVQVMDFGNTRDGEPYMVMELVNGRSLSERLESSGPLTLSQMLAVFLQVSSAMAYAHRQGVIHRDLKPGNIMLEEGEAALTARVIDFSLALFADTEETSQHELAGTPLYISPESIRQEKVDGRSDIYALGCIMFECLCGHPPFQGKTSWETVQQHLTAAPPDVLDYAGRHTDEPEHPGYSECHKMLSALISDCLKKELDKRIQTMEDVHKRLSACAQAIGQDVNCDIDWSGDSWQTDMARSLGRLPWSGLLVEDTGALKLRRMVFVGTIMIISLVAYAVHHFHERESANRRKLSSYSKPAKAMDADINRALVQVDGYWSKLESKIGPRKDFTDDELLRGEVNLKVEKLIIKSPAITDKGIDGLLKFDGPVLYIGEAMITDNGLKKIAAMTNIKKLHLDQMPNITDNGIAHLRNLRKLCQLSLQNTNITDKALESIKEMKEIDSLDLSGCQKLTAAGIKTLRSMPVLSVLALNGTALSPGILTEFQHLRSVKLECMKLRDDDMMSIGKLKHLKYLTITGSTVTRAGLEYLLDCPSLKEIRMARLRGVSQEEVEQFTIDAVKHRKELTIQAHYYI